MERCPEAKQSGGCGERSVVYRGGTLPYQGNTFLTLGSPSFNHKRAGPDHYSFLVTKSCPTPCDHMNCITPGSSVLHYLLEFAQIHVHGVSDAIEHLILCYPLLLLPSVSPSIRVFSNMSAHCIRWPKYWSFSFSISLSNEYLGLTSFRIDWFDLLAVQGTGHKFY